MFHCRWWHVTIAVMIMLCGVESVAAQSEGGYGALEVKRFNNRAVGNYSVDSLNRRELNRGQPRDSILGPLQSSLPSSTYSSLGLSSPSLGKPFASVTPAPTVSPYMNLFREDISGESDLNYQTLVRPQLDQQRINARVQRQNMELARRVQSISAQSNYGKPQGSESQYPTGHPTAFGYFSHFYPSPGRR